MVGSSVDKTGVAPKVVSAIGIGARNLRAGKLVPWSRREWLGRTPWLAGIVVVPP
ncbi:MAG: hypothetical protein ABI988_07230 [Nitrospirota bacterium]